MDLKEAKEILRAHNEWRRDVKTYPSELEMVNPIKLGQAIDKVLEFLDSKI